MFWRRGKKKGICQEATSALYIFRVCASCSKRQTSTFSCAFRFPEWWIGKVFSSGESKHLLAGGDEEGAVVTERGAEEMSARGTGALHECDTIEWSCRNLGDNVQMLPLTFLQKRTNRLLHCAECTLLWPCVAYSQAVQCGCGSRAGSRLPQDWCRQWIKSHWIPGEVLC